MRNKKNKLLLILIVLILIILLIINIINKNEKTKMVFSGNRSTLEEKLKKEKYYIVGNLERYLTYASNNDISLSKVVANVNTNVDKTKYKDVKATDTSKDELMLVNKYYYLTKSYSPSDLVTLTSKYNTGVNSSMRKDAALAFMEMSDAALLDNIIIKNASAYRSYSYQVNLYKNYVKRDGKQSADTYSSRPGFSEHQTGLATDINEINSSFENTDAFRWLSNNAYKYGFILRFPKDKEDITGYQYEAWHYRFVGKDVAKIIYDENISFEEYYAFYVENKNVS